MDLRTSLHVIDKSWNIRTHQPVLQYIRRVFLVCYLFPSPAIYIPPTVFTKPHRLHSVIKELH